MTKLQTNFRLSAASKRHLTELSVALKFDRTRVIEEALLALWRSTFSEMPLPDEFRAASGVVKKARKASARKGRADAEKLLTRVDAGSAVEVPDVAVSDAPEVKPKFVSDTVRRTAVPKPGWKK